MGISDVIECGKCGVLVKPESNKTLYCDKCQKEILKEQRIEINKKYYNSNKIKTK